MTRDLLLDLARLMDRELAPLDTWPPQHAPAVDVEAVVECRRRVVDLLVDAEVAA